MKNSVSSYRRGKVILDVIEDLKQIENKYPGYHKNYCWIEANTWYSDGEIVVPKDQKEVICHLDQSEELLFNIAADRLKNNGRGAHNGFHWHIHAAEDFYNFIVKN